MRVCIDHMAFNAKGQQYKNRNPMTIPEILNLTEYMTYGNDATPVPVRYKLRHVVYHQSAGLDGGHYAAAVTRIRNQPSGAKTFFCNDPVVTDFTYDEVYYDHEVTNMLLAPQLNMGDNDDVQSDYDPTYLIYVRLPTRPATVIVENTTVGERITRQP